MHDGTKIRANASSDTFHREKTIQEHLEAARALVEELSEAGEEVSERVRGRRERARRERRERLELAQKEMEKLREGRRGEEAKKEARVSESDPESRMMKQSDGGYAPSYNGQISVDESCGIIVGAGASQSGSDYGELLRSVERIEGCVGKAPKEMVTDGGFVSRENIVEMAKGGIEWIGPMGEGEAQRSGQMGRYGIGAEYEPGAFLYEAESDTYVCPAGNRLRHDGREVRAGVTKHIYRASAKECGGCAAKGRCCPQAKRKGRRITRSEEAPEVLAFRAKMARAESKGIYRERGKVSEFVNAWLKEKIGLKRFRLRGLVKVGMELLWGCLAYNIQQWVRLRWRPAQAAA
jgi:hypothetical protein